MKITLKNNWNNFPDVPYVNSMSILYSVPHLLILRDTLPHKLLLEESNVAWMQDLRIGTCSPYRAVMSKDIKELFEECPKLVSFSIKLTRNRIDPDTGTTIPGRAFNRVLHIAKGLLIVDGVPYMVVTIDRSLPLHESNLRIHIRKDIKSYPSLYKMMIQILEDFQGEVSIREDISDSVIAKFQLPEKTTIAKVTAFQREVLEEVIQELQGSQ